MAGKQKQGKKSKKDRKRRKPAQQRYVSQNRRALNKLTRMRKNGARVAVLVRYAELHATGNVPSKAMLTIAYSGKPDKT